VPPAAHDHRERPDQWARQPWDVAFAPGGDMYFTERVGRINLWTGGQRRVLATPADVVAIGEGGMMGVAVDPAFASNRRIYTCFLSDAGGPLDVRVVRWQVNAARTGLTGRADGTAYSIEHGPNRDDEVSRLVRGGNYGWDPVPGYNESVPMTERTKFPNARVALWSSGTPTIAPSGGTILSGSQWVGWNGALATAVLKGQQLRVSGFTPDGLAVEAQWTAITDRGRLRSAVQGTDGRLYIATDAGGGAGAILRVVPAGG
jgi:glucose/arabinose dehydrogenase